MTKFCTNSCRKLASGLGQTLMIHALINGKQLHSYQFMNGIYMLMLSWRVIYFIFMYRCLHFKLNLSSWWYSWTPASWFDYWRHQSIQPRFERWTSFHLVEARPISCRDMTSNTFRIIMFMHKNFWHLQDSVTLAVTALTYSKDAQYLAVGHHSGLLQLWRCTHFLWFYHMQVQ